MTATPIAATTATPIATPIAATNVIAAPIAVAAPAAPLPAFPSRALIEKFGAGDRAWLSGDYRAALFAYQDAVYLDPTSAAARIRLARAYQALRHEDEARQQLAQALELDPDNAEARRLLDGLKGEPPDGTARGGGSPVPATVQAPAQVPAQVTAGAGPAPATAPKIYKLTEDDAVTAPPGARPPDSKSPLPASPSPAATAPGR